MKKKRPKKRWAISDIHGNGRAFLKLLDYVDPDPEQMVICGDLVNRGLESWEVLEECAQLLDEGAHILRGNHDQAFFAVQADPTLATDFYDPMVGGVQTVRSIALAKERFGEDKVEEVLIKIFKKMVNYYEDSHFIFVHAGLNPRIPYMEDQKTNDLVMGCADWKNPALEHPFDQVVVFGHTPTYHIHKNIVENDARVWFSRKARKLGIDTGAGFGYRLTMVDLWEGIAYAYDFASREIIDYQFKKAEAWV
jgi:serine/threonine protein phosphatase 1